jgi:hypothetical protein
MPKGDIIERLIVEILVVKRLVFIDLLKDWLSFMSNFEQEFNKLCVKQK